MKKNFLLLILLFFLSCNKNRTKFNSEKWKGFEIYIEEGREQMLFDFTRNVLVINKTSKKEIDSLIGKYQSKDSLEGCLEYLVREKYGWNIDPEGYIYLKLYFDKDSIVNHWLIEETTFNP